MAPNRKSLSALLQTFSSEDLVGLQSSILPAKSFLPLTHPEEEAASQRCQESARTSDSLASYWDWPSRPVEENDSTYVLSTDNIVSNLVQAASSLQTSSRTVPSSDEYWSEASQHEEPEASLAATKPQHEQESPSAASSYWYWEAAQDESKVVLDRILEEEDAYRRVSAASIQALEERRAAAEQRTQVSSESYWTWESQPSLKDHVDFWTWETPGGVTQEDAQARLVQDILEYESARQLLMASTMVQQLQQAAAAKVASTKPITDNYWTWSSQGEADDHYWDMPAFSAKTRAIPAATTTTDVGYWDW